MFYVYNRLLQMKIFICLNTKFFEKPIKNYCNLLQIGITFVVAIFF
uniref:Uncharacterized protein n=1 Tax=Phyllymenia taiwanensis TaxID=1260292 RepID=R9XWD8_9FLOR|nr:hypothetical protein [Grateloupia taiwanensis]AGO19792.1 hypothetical protein [Grateloupia taiwanensis]